MTDHIVFFGKGGAGTSTLVSNISAALVEAGFRVLQVGIGLNGDSCATLNEGLPVPTVWEQLERNGSITFDSVVTRGFKNTYCIELGKPAHYQGAHSTVGALEQLLESKLIAALVPDYVLFDLSGDHDRAVLKKLLESVIVQRLFAVSSADFMSLAALNAVFQQLDDYAETHVPVTFGGIVPNGIVSSFEESFLSDFAKHTHTRTLSRIPRSQVVRQCELYGKTVIEASPLSNQSYFYRRLANQIVDESNARPNHNQLRPLSRAELRKWSLEWADRLHALENGLVSDGASI